MYWSANFRVDSITYRLTRNRFMETMRYLHFNDNLQTILYRDDPNYDHLWVYSLIMLPYGNNGL
ncbi:hypothetical protein T08_7373 [Trichinella sp. T8]|nr:hypothetical protein T08_7373 [Trichinella sp. T8]